MTRQLLAHPLATLGDVERAALLEGAAALAAPVLGLKARAAAAGLRPPLPPGRPPFEWTFTRHDLDRVLAKIADREPHLKLAA